MVALSLSSRAVKSAEPKFAVSSAVGAIHGFKYLFAAQSSKWRYGSVYHIKVIDDGGLVRSGKVVPCLEPWRWLIAVSTLIFGMSSSIILRLSAEKLFKVFRTPVDECLDGMLAVDSNL